MKIKILHHIILCDSILEKKIMALKELATNVFCIPQLEKCEIN
jgi:hypothetical protein